MRCLWLLATCLTGCFVQMGVGYSPGAKLSVQRATDPAAITHTDNVATFNFRLGVYLDFYGIGAYYAPFSPRVTRSADGFYKNLAPRGDYYRLDVDVPFRFGPNKMFGVRASYVHQTFEKVGSGPNNWTATGSGNAGGISLSAFNKDVSLNVLVGKMDWRTTDGRPMYPDYSMEAYDIDVGFTFRFIPTGSIMDHYVYEPSQRPDVGRTTSRCGWAGAVDGGGYSCSL